jgi:hypothetical protein
MGLLYGLVEVGIRIGGRMKLPLLAIVASAVASAAVCTNANLAASATFTSLAGGTQLLITLDNTAACDVNDPPDTLGALFFEYTGSQTFTPVEAFIGTGAGEGLYSGNSAIAAPGSNGAYVGHEFRYQNAFSIYGGTYHGITSVGYGLVDTALANFGCSTAAHPVACDQVNGPPYGILSAGDNLTTGNGGISGKILIFHSVQFLFNVSGGPVDLSKFGDLSFQYGTSLADACIGYCTGGGGGGEAPEPASILLLGTTLVITSRVFLRRRRSTKVLNSFQ